MIIKRGPVGTAGGPRGPSGDQGVQVVAKSVAYGHPLRPPGGSVAHLRGFLEWDALVSYWIIIKRGSVGPGGGPWAHSAPQWGSSGGQGCHVVVKVAPYGHSLRLHGVLVAYLRGFLQWEALISYRIIIFY